MGSEYKELCVTFPLGNRPVYVKRIWVTHPKLEKVCEIQLDPKNFTTRPIDVKYDGPCCY